MNEYFNPVEVGRKFEERVYNQLLTEYDIVDWCSFKKRTSRQDFICEKNGKTEIIDAKKSVGQHILCSGRYDKIITEKNGELIEVIVIIRKLKENTAGDKQR